MNLDTIFAEDLDEANLGCATTRQLLVEIRARLGDEPQGAGEAVATEAGRALELLDEKLLDYRTID